MLHLKDESMPYSLPNTVQWKMFSRFREQEYRIFIYKPPSPAPPEGYPVLYLLDGNAIFGSMVEAVRLQTRKPHGLEPVAVVGIGYPTDGPFDLEGRFLDYTVNAAADELPPRKNGMPWPKVGEADAFLQFIEEQLRPEIEKSMPINQERQALFGHSLGGFFTLYTLFTRQEMFQTYIAGSPSIWWKNKFITSLEKAFYCQLVENPSARETALYIGVGGEEKDTMVTDARGMYDRMAAESLPQFRIAFRVFEEEGHVSVLHPLISRALSFFLKENK